MTRIENLNAHLSNLTQLGEHGDYGTQIQNTILEIEKELGLNGHGGLSSYSTKELHEELSKREEVDEVIISLDQEAVVTKISGDLGQDYSYQGPVRVLVNKD